MSEDMVTMAAAFLATTLALRFPYDLALWAVTA